jgi:F-type H+-transporting ATPase subunit delta
MTTATIAQRYASALVDVVMSPAHGTNPDESLTALQAFRDLVSGSPDLRQALESPAVPLTRKRALIDRLVERLSTPRTVRNFLLVLSDKRRLSLLHEVTDQFDILLDERRGFLRAQVESAAELNPTEQAEIGKQLSQLTHKQVRTRFTLNPDLIGGVLARVGSTVYDGSVKAQLAQLRVALAHGQLL